MTRDRIDGIGFHHPSRNARPLTKRKIAVAHLLMTAVLVICIVVAATAVTFGMARADTLAAISTSGEAPVVMLIAFFFAMMASICLIVTRSLQQRDR